MRCSWPWRPGRRCSWPATTSGWRRWRTASSATARRRAAVAPRKLAGGAPGAMEEPIGRALKRALGQAVLIAIAVAPVSIFIGWLPLFGTAVVKAVAGGWALHWIVVNAFDSARVLQPGQTLDDL